MSLIEDIRKDREAGTSGDWTTPYETWDNGWSLDTGGENSYMGIGVAGCGTHPIAITAVESAFGRDCVLDANARRIARVPQMEAALLAAEELADAFEAYQNAAVDHMDFQIEAEAALAAYRAATGAA